MKAPTYSRVIFLAFTLGFKACRRFALTTSGLWRASGLWKNAVEIRFRVAEALRRLGPRLSMNPSPLFGLRLPMLAAVGVIEQRF